MVPKYDLLRNRRMDVVTINNISLFLSRKTNRFHVGVGLYSNRSQHLVCHFFVFITFLRHV